MLSEASIHVVTFLKMQQSLLSLLPVPFPPQVLFQFRAKTVFLSTLCLYLKSIWLVFVVYYKQVK